MSDGRRGVDVIDVYICVHARPLGLRLLEISSSSHRSSSDRRPDAGVKVGMGITVVHIGAILCFFGDYSLGLGYSSIASASWKDGLRLRQHALPCRATLWCIYTYRC